MVLEPKQYSDPELEYQFISRFFSEGYRRYLALCLTSSVSQSVSQSVSAFLFLGDVARRRQTSYDVARLRLMAPMGRWRNSTPFFGAAALCTTKIDGFTVSVTLTSMTT